METLTREPVMVLEETPDMPGAPVEDALEMSDLVGAKGTPNARLLPMLGIGLEDAPLESPPTAGGKSDWCKYGKYPDDCRGTGTCGASRRCVF